MHITFTLPFRLKGTCREFHVSRYARDRYKLAKNLFSLKGDLLLADFSTAQQVSHQINEARDASRFPETAIKAGDLYAAGLVDELLHMLVETYRQEINSKVLAEALLLASSSLGDDFKQTLSQFAFMFPATAIYTGETSVDSYLDASTDGLANSEIVLEELLMLYLANSNPALKPFSELIDDSSLEPTAYKHIIELIKDFFAKAPPLVAGAGSLFDMLRAPALASPDSLEGQLAFMKAHWAPVLGKKFTLLLERLLTTLDILKEEQKMGFMGGPAPSHVLDFVTLAGETLSKRERHEYERFSPDKAWMPRVVMLAKSSYVWLDQLSKQYQQSISKLDQIPDSELDELARRGFTSLWLIGLWERSEASKRIKHLRGQADAVASAYALYDYQIAQDLGGDSAYENLRDRAWQRGIRLASDMVPNHVGIDGRWVIEHPDWFLQLDHSPYPGYSFSGPDLSSDERIAIFLEDHYYDNSDAAVVFKRLDRWTGESRYIYHGNDGTTMPWNDTAQLNYLNSETREAIIQTILHVARKFPIIRFDAAMTLAKQHIQRLWFPEPGHGGAIPSRSHYGSMNHEDFERAIPQEFWREVVDRVAEELPDTLLLAEAFWMMEGYFVRTLGMHRVYNSAFMNMLKQEENAKYRQSIKNTLEFDPEILKRFVNFMNNPDEEPAIEQFGKDDKYFGVCLLMSTMPGLPMFGHGQIEGFHEKYGMEYRRAKWQESADSWLIARHYREIFPLLHRRAEFAEVDHFLLYDFYDASNQVNEDVFAYSNNYQGKASLIIYNNNSQSAKGWLKRSASFKDKQDGQLKQRDLAEGLGLQGDAKHFVILREQTSQLEYLQRSSQLRSQGFYSELEAFKYQVYLDIQEVYDSDGKYEVVFNQLQGQGTDSIAETILDLDYQPLYTAFDAFLKAPSSFAAILQSAQDLERKLAVATAHPTKTLAQLGKKLTRLDQHVAQSDLADYSAIVAELKPLIVMLASLRALDVKAFRENAQSLRLKRYWQQRYGQEQADLLSAFLEISEDAFETRLRLLMTKPTTQSFIAANTHEGITWFNRERFRLLLTSVAAIQYLENSKTRPATLFKRVRKLEQASEYQLAKLMLALEAVKPPAKALPKKLRVKAAKPKKPRKAPVAKPKKPK